MSLNTPKTSVAFSSAKNFAPCLHERSRSSDVVGAVDYNLIVKDLKARRPFDGSEATRDGVFGNFSSRSAQRSHREFSIFLLVCSDQCGVAFVQTGNELNRRVAFGGSNAKHLFCFHFLPGRNNRNFSLNDSRFFAGDFFQRFAEPGLMIEIDRSDYGNNRLQRIGGIESPAHTGLEHDDLAILLSEVQQSQRGSDFEKRRIGIPIRDSVANFCEPAGHAFFRNHLAVHANAFAKRDKVRGGEETGAVTLCATDGIDHRADRAFAVRASNMNDARVSLRKSQCAQQFLDVLQSQLDPETLGGIKPGECLFVRGELLRRRRRDRLATNAFRARDTIFSHVYAAVK